jgi:hypothetical protein
MGALYQHNVLDYINKYNLINYVETGTGSGECLSHALTFNFNKLCSVEIYPQIFKEVSEKFKDTKAEIFLGNSYEVLPKIIENLEGNTLFFLDAHFPGADFHYESYNSTKDYNTRLPLEKEVESICKSKDISKDVFIIDDLRVYEDNDYSDGNWPLRKEAGGDGIVFIYNSFSETHNIERDLRFQGFLIITPKK